MVQNYELDFSYNGCMIFDQKIKIIKSYMAATVSIATLLIIIKQKIIEKRTLDNAYIFERSKYIKDFAMKIYPYEKDILRIFVNKFCLYIATDIYYMNNYHQINNKKELETIVNKYIKDHIRSFEEYYCKDKFSTQLFYTNGDIQSYSYQYFHKFANILFFISPTYTEFDKDIAIIYNNYINKIAKNVNKKNKDEVQSLY